MWATAKVRAEGDGKVASDLSLTSANPPAGPQLGAVTQRLSYRYSAGWKFAQVDPTRPAPIEGEPHRFGLWVYGDAKGGSPRLRVIDAKGQTWQPAGPVIDWTGWRFIEFTLEPSTQRWGGPDDGVIHYPLRWSSLFLLDNPSRQEVTGEVYLSQPVVIE